MKQTTGTVLLAGLLLGSVPGLAEDGDSAGIFPYDVVTETLANGLRVVLVPMSSGGLASYWTVVRTGARDEYEPGRTGFAHFFEHMMFRGTEKYPAEEFNQFFTGIGAEPNAFTSDDLTAYMVSIAAEDLERVMEVESDRFQNLSYPKEMFQTEAGAVYGEYRKNRTNPFFALSEAVQETAFEVHTYGHTVMGYEDDIRRMPELYEYSKAFFSRYYRPENVVLMITGDLEVTRTMEWVRRYYGGWKPGYVAPEITPEPEQTGEKHVEVEYEGRTLPLVWIGYKCGAFDPADRDYVAVELFGDLAFGETSEIYKKLVIDEQVVEFIGVTRRPNRDPGLYSIVAQVKDPGKIDYVLAEIDRVLAEAGETPPEKARLEELKSRIKYSFLMNLDTPSSVARALSRYLAVAGDHRVIDRYFEAVEAVTAEDVRAAVRRQLVSEKRTVAVLKGAGKKEEDRPVLLPVPDDPTVSFAISFGVGSQDDPPGKEGLAALTGALISDGATEVSTYDEILKKLYPLASGYSVTVDKEMTTLTGRTHIDNVDVFLGLFSDAYLRPALAEDDLERLRSNQLNAIENTLRYSSDEELGKAALMSFIFEGTSYRHPVEGTVAGLNSITVDDVRQFYRTHYTRENATLALGGGYSQDLLARFEATLDELGSAEETTEPAVDPAPFEGRHVLLVSKPEADASISFGFPITARRGERDFYALWLANSWLGEHRSSASHLYQVIRDVRGLNYGDYSYVEAYPNGGRRTTPPPNVARRHQIFEVWIRTLPNEQAHFALRAAMREVEDLIDHGMSEEEFELTQAFLSKYYLNFAETTRTRLAFAVDDRFYGIEGKGHLDRFGEMIRSLTREEVNAAIKKHLQHANVKIAIVTGEAEELAEALKSDQPSPITYPAPKSDDILEEDEVIGKYPLRITSVEIVPGDEMFEQ